MIVPLGLSVIAVEVWRAGDAGQRVRRIVGGVVTVASIVGLITLGQDGRGRVGDRRRRRLGGRDRA